MIILSFRNPQKTYITVRLGAWKKHKIYARGCIKLLRPHKIIFLFPVPAHITFGERIKKNFIVYFIEFDVFVTTINYFSVKAEPFCPLFQSKYVSIRFYDYNITILLIKW